MSKWEYTETELWRHGSGDISLFHVFGLIAVRSTVLAFSEAREGDGKDADSCHSIYMRRSTDGGRSFESSVCLLDSEECHCWTNPVPLYDEKTHRLFLFYSENQGNCRTQNYVICSDDLGRSWSMPQEVTQLLEGENRLVPFHLAGPGHGIQLKNGLHAGRLMMPFWHRKYGVEKPVRERGYCISVLYSDDHGISWKHTNFYGQDYLSNETRLVETDQELLWVVRPGIPDPHRYLSRSRDGGITWGDFVCIDIEPASNCDAGAVAVRGKQGFENLVLISRVGQLDKRRDMEILISLDGGNVFADKLRLLPGDTMPGYSDLCVVEEEEPVIGLLHCRNNHVLFTRISLQTLTGGAYENTQRTVWQE